MNAIKRPRLFIVKELNVILSNAISEMEDIKYEIDSLDKQYQIKSILTYIFARYESAISECLIKFLVAFSEKIDTSKINIKDDLILLSQKSIPTDFIRSLCESYISILLYKKLDDFLKIVEDHFVIDINSKIVSNKLKERKATRNLLVHNNLRVNRTYINAAGTSRRSNKIGEYLKIDSIYIIETIEIMTDSLRKLKDEICNKYANYTTLNLLKNLWYYLFDSSLLKFEDYWSHDEKDILGFNIEFAVRKINNLSSYEQTLLAIWVQQFSSDIHKNIFKDVELRFWMPILDEVAFINEIIGMYPYIFYGKEKEVFPEN